MPFGLPNISYVGYPLPIPCAPHAGLGFREISRGDATGMLDHLRALPPEDRRMRFCASVNDDHLLRHVASAPARNTFALAAFDGPLWSGTFLRQGPIRALAEFAVSGDVAELGVSVERSIRRRGVATYLIQTSARLLAQRGVARVIAYTMAGNRSFLALARKAGARVEIDGSEVEVTFDVARLEHAYLRRRLADRVFGAVA
jgi:RimJ/RimL family protein N-acetyltransferase